MCARGCRGCRRSRSSSRPPGRPLRRHAENERIFVRFGGYSLRIEIERERTRQSADEAVDNPRVDQLISGAAPQRDRVGVIRYEATALAQIVDIDDDVRAR